MRIIPVWDMTDQRRRIMQGSAAELIKMRMRETLGGFYNYTFYDLFPSDLGLTSWKLPEIAATENNKMASLYRPMTHWVHLQNSMQHIVVFEGLAWMGIEKGPDEIRFGVRSIIVRAWYHLAKLYLTTPVLKRIQDIVKQSPGEAALLAPGLRAEAFFDLPILIEPGEIVDIELKSYSGLSGGDELILLGYIVKLTGEMTALETKKLKNSSMPLNPWLLELRRVLRGGRQLLPRG